MNGSKIAIIFCDFRKLQFSLVTMVTWQRVCRNTKIGSPKSFYSKMKINEINSKSKLNWTERWPLSISKHQTMAFVFVFFFFLLFEIWESMRICILISRALAWNGMFQRGAHAFPEYFVVLLVSGNWSHLIYIYKGEWASKREIITERLLFSGLSV